MRHSFLKGALVGGMGATVVMAASIAWAANGGNFILGQSNSATNVTGLSGSSANGMLSVTDTHTSATAAAIQGKSSTANQAGVRGTNAVVSGIGVIGVVAGTAGGAGYGTDGRSTNGTGVRGIHSAATGASPGVSGVTNSASGAGVRGTNSAASGTGVQGVANGGRGVAGFSDTFQGVYGHSNANAGVVGDSLNFDGVYGVSESATHAAVSAHNDVWGGFGVWAAGGDVANNTAAVHGQSAKGNAVEGISGKNTASGVYGENDSTGFGVAGRAVNGTGVLADSANGWALNASGNATQSRTNGGIVKAMALIDPFQADPIRQCYNSQVGAANATFGDCGIAYSRTGACNYVIGFGFEVDDRFVSVTGYGGAVAWSVSRVNVPQTAWRVVGSCTDVAFFIVVY